MKIRILKIDPKTRDTSNPEQLIQEFSTPTALTDALIYWDDHALHKQPGTVITVADEYNEVTTRLSRKLFEEL